MHNHQMGFVKIIDFLCPDDDDGGERFFFMTLY